MIKLILFISFQIYALEANFNPKEFVRPGNIFEATINIWPVNKHHLKKIKEKVGSEIFPYVYLHHIVSHHFSPHNIEYLTLKGLFIATKFFDKETKHLLELNGENILVNWHGDGIEEVKIKIPKDYYFYKNPIKKEEKTPFYFSMVILLLSVFYLLVQLLCFPLKKYIEKRKIRDLLSIIENIKIREDYENLVEFSEKISEKLISEIKNNMYKKEWTDEIYKLLKDLCLQEKERLIKKYEL